MVEVKELNISSMEQPAHVKVMRGPGGRYDYEISYHSGTLREALNMVKAARIEIERELEPITMNTEKKE